MILSIILLNYKKYRLTLSCIASLFNQYADELNAGSMEIIIVDNASGDESVDVLSEEIKKQNYKNVLLISNTENAGFGKGCNLGAAHARGKYLLFLNNDTTVMDTGLTAMTAYLDEHENVAILGGQLRNPDRSLQASAGDFYTLDRAILLLLGMQKYGLLDKSPTETTEVDWVKGGLLMIRKEVFEKLDGFDKDIFMYIEDMELCYRAKLQGYKVYFYPHINVLHAEHGSTNRTFAIVHIYKNLLYFYKKHRSIFEYTVLKFLLTLKALVLIGVGKVTGRDYLSSTYTQALSAIRS